MSRSLCQDLIRHKENGFIMMYHRRRIRCFLNAPFLRNRLCVLLGHAKFCALFLSVPNNEESPHENEFVQVSWVEAAARIVGEPESF